MEEYTAGIPIHPPIQGGNWTQSYFSDRILDTPSHTGRKPVLEQARRTNSRYTLPYREETLSVYAGFSHLKRFVVQFAQMEFFHY